LVAAAFHEIPSERDGAPMIDIVKIWDLDSKSWAEVPVEKGKILLGIGWKRSVRGLVLIFEGEKGGENVKKCYIERPKRVWSLETDLAKGGR
jgi:hypothetical protein